MEALECIRTRRSVRQFAREPVDEDLIREVLLAGSWAPSGLNNQPWRFALARDEAFRAELSGLTKYGRIIRAAPVCIALFVDEHEMYDEVKDCQAAGACVQNMLLAAHALGLGAVWLGEILKNAGRARELFGLPGHLRLMAVVALGHLGPGERTSTRKGLEELVLKEI